MTIARTRSEDENKEASPYTMMKRLIATQHQQGFASFAILPKMARASSFLASSSPPKAVVLKSLPDASRSHKLRLSRTSLAAQKQPQQSTSISRRTKSTTVSKRGASAVQLLPSYLADARSVTKYSAETPDGALQLGVAESKMLEDWLVPVLNPSEGLKIPADCIYYQSTPGRPTFRASMATFLEGLLDLPEGRMDVEGMVVGAGCNAVLENLCLVLADPGEAVLIPTPYYAAFEFDLVARASLHVEAVHTLPHNDKQATNLQEKGLLDPSVYYPTVESLDAAYEAAALAGHAPRVLLLSHPQNPLGVCYPPETMRTCIDWCRERQVHLVSDEIYAGSVYRPDLANFTSVLKLASDQSADGGLGPFVHFVWAMSKDFAMSGMRVGVAYSENPDIRMPLQKLNDLCQISSQTQVWTEQMLTRKHDDNGQTSWTTAFRQENYKRLNARCEALTAVLEECKIPYLTPTSGLFCWIDLSAHLPTEGTDAERERALYLRLVQDFGLLLTPSNSMRHEKPGYFRIVFTAATDEEFAVGLERFRKFAAATAN